MRRYSYSALSFPLLILAYSLILLCLLIIIRKGSSPFYGILLIIPVILVSYRKGVQVGNESLTFFTQYFVFRFAADKKIALHGVSKINFDKQLKKMTVRQYRSKISYSRKIVSCTFSLKITTNEENEKIIYQSLSFIKIKNVADLVSKELNLIPEKRIIEEIFPSLGLSKDEDLQKITYNTNIVDEFPEETDNKATNQEDIESDPL